MRWTEGEPTYGDMIRVAVKFYHHYGIYVDEGQVVQFGYPDNSGIKSEDVAVLTSDLVTFAHGGCVEVGALSMKELFTKRSANETVKYALSRLGQGGYDILHNNCEHFAMECMFGEPRSSLVDGVRQEVRRKLNKVREQ